MPFDPFQSLAGLEKISPPLARFSAMFLLSWISPFNAHLNGKMLEWSDGRCTIRVRRCRSVRNHVKGIHAGALFTLGETCAGLVIVRNFPFGQFRPLMSDVKVNYSKQARGDVVGQCVIPPETIARIHEELKAEQVPNVEVVTNILNTEQEIIAVVTTTWQVKPWGLVRTKPV